MKALLPTYNGSNTNHMLRVTGKWSPHHQLAHYQASGKQGHQFLSGSSPNLVQTLRRKAIIPYSPWT